MSEDNKLLINTNVFNIDFSGLSKVGELFVKKIYSAARILYQPTNIRRMADALVYAKKVESIAEIEATERFQRAAIRFIQEEEIKQENIENITQKAIHNLSEEIARPDDIANDWIFNFYDKCRLVSDEEMQNLWAKVLAGEANCPGTFSKRTVNLLAFLEKSDAELFRNLCSYCWVIEDGLVLLVYDYSHPIYSQNNIIFETLTHLEDIGLVRFDPRDGFMLTFKKEMISASYNQRQATLQFKEANHKLYIGNAKLSKTGFELYSVCGCEPIDGLFEATLDKWNKYHSVVATDTTPSQPDTAEPKLKVFPVFDWSFQ